MKHIKEYNQFVNEEEGFFKNLLLSAMLALGINSVDAQTIQQDSVKTEIVKNISQFNKSIILTDSNYEIKYIIVGIVLMILFIVFSFIKEQTKDVRG